MQWAIYLNNGASGFVYDSTWVKPAANVNFNTSIVTDVNGDSLVDIINGGIATIGTDDRATYINNGIDGWIPSGQWKPPVYFNRYSGDSEVRLTDVNADGLVDIVHAFGDFRFSNSSVTQEIYLNTGSGWQQSTTWTLPNNFYFLHVEGYGISYPGFGEMMDVNGDGLPDIVQYDKNQRGFGPGIYLNNGNGGWDQSVMYTVPAVLVERQNKYTTYGDFNTDGFIDFAISERTTDVVNEVYLNNGTNGWALATNWQTPTIFWELFNSATDKGVREGDINGDGLSDFIQSTDNTQALYAGNPAYPDILSKVAYSEGGNTELAYTPSTKHTNTKAPFVLQTIASATTSDALGTSITTNYAYDNGYYHKDPTDPRKNAFTGFQRVTTTDAKGNITKRYFHQGEGSADGSGQG
ncbi:MAG: toxin TcdB middle/N-terminal domain-containing protein, partial [Patescibacteria group bacterium]